jgi:predicted dehydrogenase
MGMGKATYAERRVLKESSPLYGEAFAVEVPTYIAAILEFHSGEIANLVLTFDLGFPYWESHLPFIRIEGSEGSLDLPDVNRFDGAVGIRKNGESEFSLIESTPFYENCRGIGLADMALTLGGGEEFHNGKFRADSAFALHTMEILFGVMESINTGREYAMSTSCNRPDVITESDRSALVSGGTLKNCWEIT